MGGTARHLPAAQQLVIEQMEGTAYAIAAGLADAHMQRGATQMEPREVAAREREQENAITNRVERWKAAQLGWSRRVACRGVTTLEIEGRTTW